MNNNTIFTMMSEKLNTVLQAFNMCVKGTNIENAYLENIKFMILTWKYLYFKNNTIFFIEDIESILSIIKNLNVIQDYSISNSPFDITINITFDQSLCGLKEIIIPYDDLTHDQWEIEYQKRLGKE